MVIDPWINQLSMGYFLSHDGSGWCWYINAKIKGFFLNGIHGTPLIWHNYMDPSWAIVFRQTQIRWAKKTSHWLVIPLHTQYLYGWWFQPLHTTFGTQHSQP